MNEHLQNLRDMYKFKLEEAGGYYDFAEGISAKVKLYVALHKRMIVVLAATHFVAFVVGIGMP